MAHVSEDYGAAPPDAVTVRARDIAAAAPNGKPRPGIAAERAAAKAVAARVRDKLGTLCAAQPRPMPP